VPGNRSSRIKSSPSMSSGVYVSDDGVGTGYGFAIRVATEEGLPGPPLKPKAQATAKA
jgi:hypothetical protein